MSNNDNAADLDRNVPFQGITFRAVLAVSCPKCGRPAGLGCLTPTFYSAAPHGVRIKAAKAASKAVA